MKRYWFSKVLLLASSTVFADGVNLFNLALAGNELLISTKTPNRTYAQAGIRLNSTGLSIANPSSVCSSVVKGFCLFSVSDTSAKIIDILGNSSTFSATLCLNGQAQISCQNYQLSRQERFAYIANFYGDSISLCNVDLESGLLSGCTTTGSGFASPSDIVFNPTGTRAYVTNYYSDDVSVCSVDKTTGALSNCAVAASFDVSSSPQGIAINSLGNKAYVVLDCSNEIANCDVDQATGALINCTLTTPNTLFRPSDIVLSASERLAYIPNRNDDTVSVCPIDANTGLINTCTNSGSGFSAPEGVSLNPKGNLLYVGNDNSNSVTYCAVNSEDGSLSNCQATGGAFDGFGNIILNRSNTKAYVPNSGSNTVSICNVDADTGALSTCIESGGTGFSGPSSVMLY